MFKSVVFIFLLSNLVVSAFKCEAKVQGLWLENFPWPLSSWLTKVGTWFIRGAKVWGRRLSSTFQMLWTGCDKLCSLSLQALWYTMIHFSITLPLSPCCQMNQALKHQHMKALCWCSGTPKIIFIVLNAEWYVFALLQSLLIYYAVDIKKIVPCAAYCLI